ncbi:YHS domain-containing (seleno)protein [Emcibacter sp.]|uniref:YHS domain-containing (seleno)protein n=1 Tax=Emcibacter sp. TaxID=1979954 RepID=UPI002AA7237E|nr:YHS domain-containing (seleno)protein [Emcibacter sp.]
MDKLPKYLLFLSAFTVAILGGLAFYYTSQSYFADSLIYDDDNGIAIHGYDPVAYFTEEKAVYGDPLYEVSWAGSRWRFASPENRDLFADDPNKFAPQYGGYEPVMIVKGYSSPTDPLIWSMRDGLLYLHHNEQTKAYWLENFRDNRIQADASWPRIRSQLQYIQSQSE